eukprot:3284367-Pyramimonas_sp.AAC.1
MPEGTYRTWKIFLGKPAPGIRPEISILTVLSTLHSLLSMFYLLVGVEDLVHHVEDRRVDLGRLGARRGDEPD